MDGFPLSRFREAQATTYARAREEIRHGCKRTHWMWFAFPQLRGLGLSATAQFYGIVSRAEAEAYLADPVLGPRLIEISELTLSHEGSSAHAIFGSPDDLKLRSCATLFAALPDAPPVFARLLDRFYGGEADPKTLALLAGE